MPRLEENKSSCDEQEFDCLNWFSKDSEEVESPTPRFDNQAEEPSALKSNVGEFISNNGKAKASKRWYLIILTFSFVLMLLEDESIIWIIKFFKYDIYE